MVVSPLSDHVIPGVEVAISASEILGQAGAGVGVGSGVGVGVGAELVVFRALVTTGPVSGVGVGLVLSGLVWLGGVGVGIVVGVMVGLVLLNAPNATPVTTEKIATANTALISLFFLTKLTALANKL